MSESALGKQNNEFLSNLKKHFTKSATNPNLI